MTISYTIQEKYATLTKSEKKLLTIFYPTVKKSFTAP